MTVDATPSIVLSSVTLNNYSPTVGTVLTATIAPANATATILWYRDDNVYLGTGTTYTVTATPGHRARAARAATSPAPTRSR